MRSRFWGSDFVISRGRILVRKTGADLKIERQLIADALVWFGYHVLVRLKGAWTRATRPPGPSIWFEPDRPRPWYIVWSATVWAGARLARSAAEADAVFHFEDATWSSKGLARAATTFNAGCPDISKTHVAAMNARVFGYPLAIDPAAWSGPAVEKGEGNGLHDGVLVHCPMTARPGKSYQRLIDTEQDGMVEDLRTVCVQGQPVVVFVKLRPVGIRFSIQSSSAKTAKPEDVFSAEELAQITRFAQAMALDWGGLDVLRDRSDGRLYVVDVNKTDVGPAVALSWRDKVTATEALAGALIRMVGPVPAPAAVTPGLDDAYTGGAGGAVMTSTLSLSR